MGFSLAFNTIIPDMFHQKLTHLHLPVDHQLPDAQTSTGLSPYQQQVFADCVERYHPAPPDDVSRSAGYFRCSGAFDVNKHTVGRTEVSGMNCDQLLLHPRVSAALRRVQLMSVKDVVCASAPDLQRLTGLSNSDVQQLITAAAAVCRRHPPITAQQLQHGVSGAQLRLGCPVLDRLLRGGLPVGGITELAGESGTGKTQVGLQLSLSVQYPAEHGGLGAGALYVCTEDSFPIKRLHQLIGEQVCLRSDVPADLVSSLRFSDHVYIEHTADLDSLLVCLTRRARLLLTRGLVRLIVVDSVAALFRTEFQADDWLERNRQLLTFSSMLHHLSQEFSTPVLCINQVTDVFSQSHNSMGPSLSTVSPALGLAWANQVMVRLMMSRLQGTVVRGDQSSALRRLEVVFAPHLARDGQNAAVWREGLRGVESWTSNRK
ncbi:DNA repair protein XRCC3 isoform X2 [Haplochromis burtoni]|uniref:DNA repair protein XRCC3 isoform X2 n=1 Tax=Haplochromis burtoni TaxID=8153 RepID=UPI0003BC5C54|nr:DNA repair protein XRCC3 isoform X2 [Haplochromis burtoni]